MTMAAKTGVRVRAYAKINLTLHVGPKQDDGYHPIESVFQALALHDTLTCTPGRGAFKITCDDPAVPTDTSNLVWKAAKAIWAAMGRSGEPTGATVAITKQIPVAAGLGGGSSDAAAALVALDHVWKAGLSDGELMEIASSLGADVPFFLFGGTALGLGRGDRLFPLVDLDPRWVVLACPAFGVSTADAYGWFDEAPEGLGSEGGGLAVWDAGVLEVFNDLQEPVVQRHSAILELIDTLADAGAQAASMTGSGSAVFGLFARETQAKKAAHLAAATGSLALVTKTATRRESLRMLKPGAAGRR
jgi:4-diphosphocytidyl-2-C-methyl-D-erythritol kinase